MTQAVRDPAPSRGDDAPASSALDLGVRVLGGTVALLAGAASAVVEAFLVPLRLGDWPSPAAPLIAALVGVPLVSFAARATGNRTAALLPLVGWFAAIALLLVRTVEGDVVLVETAGGFGVILLGAGSLIAGLYRLPSARRQSGARR